MKYKSISFLNSIFSKTVEKEAYKYIYIKYSIDIYIYIFFICIGFKSTVIMHFSQQI